MNTNNIQKQIEILFKRWLFLQKHHDKNVWNNFIYIFKNNQITLKEIKRSHFFNVYFFDEFYSSDKTKVIKLLKKFQNYFEIINYNNNEILIFFDNRLFKIYFNKKIPKNIKYINKYFIFFYKLKSMYSPNYISTYLNNFLSNIFRKNKIYNLTYNDFLKLDISSIVVSNNLRDKNMALITNYGKNKTIKDIIIFFKKKKNKNKIFKIFFKKKLFFNSLKSKIPLHYNLNYWSSSNYYLISNIIHGFYKRNFKYESQNIKNNFYQIYSSKINSITSTKKIDRLTSMEDLIIIDNIPRSSRNRILAMIGHILKGGNYINFKYKKYFDQNTDKEKLINLFAEHFSIYKYQNAIITNLDSNYKKIFNDRGIDIFYDKKISKKKFELKVELKRKNIFKNFKFIEINNFLDFSKVIFFLIFNKKYKISSFYLDNKKRCNFFNKEYFFKHLLKILFTIIKLKPKMIIVLE